MSNSHFRVEFSILGALGASLLSGCATPPSRPMAVLPAPTVAVKLIAFNDFHGNLRQPSLRVPVADPNAPTGIRLEPAGGVEQFAALVHGLKQANPNHAVVSAGDMIGATPLLSALFKDEPTIEAMNLVGVDFHAVGNHEFDYGVTHLKRMQDGGCAIDAKTGAPDCGGREPFRGAKFQFLSANTIVHATGKTLFPATGIKSFEGVKIGFIGLTLKGTADIVRPDGTVGVRFADETETVRALIPSLQAQGAKAIVVVMHQGGVQHGGFDACDDFAGVGRDLALQFPAEIDVVVQGHTHRFYVCPNVGGKLVTSAGSNGTSVTDIDLVLDRATGKVVSKNARNLLVAPEGPKAPALTALLERYAPLAAPLENRVVARVKTELPPLFNEHGESALGNLIADAQLHATQAPDRGGAVVAFNNAGSLRAPIVPGADGGVTYGALFRTQPFQNDLIVFTMTGRQIKTMLEQQFISLPKSSSRLVSASRGFSYSWDATKPLGEKVLASSLRLNGRAVEPDLQYRVTVNGFMAGGNEGLSVFLQGIEREVSVGDLDALVAYLAPTLDGKPYDPPPLGRVKRVN